MFVCCLATYLYVKPHDTKFPRFHTLIWVSILLGLIHFYVSSHCMYSKVDNIIMLLKGGVQEACSSQSMCLSVCLSVCVSVIFFCSVFSETAKHHAERCNTSATRDSSEVVRLDFFVSCYQDSLTLVAVCGCCQQIQKEALAKKKMLTND